MTIDIIETETSTPPNKRIWCVVVKTSEDQATFTMYSKTSAYGLKGLLESSKFTLTVKE